MRVKIIEYCSGGSPGDSYLPGEKKRATIKRSGVVRNTNDKISKCVEDCYERKINQ